MKNLITSASSLMLLLALLIQFTQSQILYTRLIAADQAMENFREITKTEGCVSVSNKERLKQELRTIFGCAEEDITILGDNTPAEQGSLISYEVRVKIRNIIATADFWNIKEVNNCFEYKVRRVVVSEYMKGA